MALGPVMAQQSLVSLGSFHIIYCDSFYGYILGKKNSEQVADQQVQCHKTVAAMWFLIAVINFHLSSSTLWRKGNWADLICCSSSGHAHQSPALLPGAALKSWKRSVEIGAGDMV